MGLDKTLVSRLEKSSELPENNKSPAPAITKQASKGRPKMAP
jgi:hypothetical protein